MKHLFSLSRRSVLFGLSACAFTFGSLSAVSAHADALSNIMQTKTIKIGVFQDYPPFGTVNADMKAQGFDIDFANIIAKDLGVTVQYVPVTGTNRIAYLTDRKVDMLMSVGQTAEREKILDFTPSYAPYYIAVFGPASVNVTGPSDLKGKTIGTAGGTNEDVSLTKVAPPEASIKRFDDQSGAISAYFSGQVNLISLGANVALKLRAPNPNLALKEKFKLLESNMHIAFNKGEEGLKSKVDAIINKSLTDGSLNKISVQWLNAPLPEKMK